MYYGDVTGGNFGATEGGVDSALKRVNVIPGHLFCLGALAVTLHSSVEPPSWAWACDGIKKISVFHQNFGRTEHLHHSAPARKACFETAIEAGTCGACLMEAKPIRLSRRNSRHTSLYFFILQYKDSIQSLGFRCPNCVSLHVLTRTRENDPHAANRQWLRPK